LKKSPIASVSSSQKAVPLRLLPPPPLPVSPSAHLDNSQPSQLFVLTTIAGYQYHLYASSAADRLSWIEAISSQKVIALLTSVFSSEMSHTAGPGTGTGEEGEGDEGSIESELKLSQQRNKELEERLKVMTGRYEEAERETTLAP
jgi:hypothetical protein